MQGPAPRSHCPSSVGCDRSSRLCGNALSLSLQSALHSPTPRPAQMRARAPLQQLRPPSDTPSIAPLTPVPHRILHGVCVREATDGPPSPDHTRNCRAAVTVSWRRFAPCARPPPTPCAPRAAQPPHCTSHLAVLSTPVSQQSRAKWTSSTGDERGCFARSGELILPSGMGILLPRTAFWTKPGRSLLRFCAPTRSRGWQPGVQYSPIARTTPLLPVSSLKRAGDDPAAQRKLKLRGSSFVLYTSPIHLRTPQCLSAACGHSSALSESEVSSRQPRGATEEHRANLRPPAIHTCRLGHPYASRADAGVVSSRRRRRDSGPTLPRRN
ncbi:hypothetical protein FKP32DRAFT_358628 [Trametes sanguinea]|nr:hypothetical protein FKP32DRAFT_358628 [Trametes sanguinea]